MATYAKRLVLVLVAVSYRRLACVCHTTQVEDWFTLKDTCPYALYDDQSRLYAAVLRMQLRCVPRTTQGGHAHTLPFPRGQPTIPSARRCSRSYRSHRKSASGFEDVDDALTLMKDNPESLYPSDREILWGDASERAACNVTIFVFQAQLFCPLHCVVEETPDQGGRIDTITENNEDARKTRRKRPARASACG